MRQSDLVAPVTPAPFGELAIVPFERIERQIYLIRGEKVMLDSDLAGLYQVSTKNLNRAVTRNPERFPEEFMFQITMEEREGLRFQIGTSNKGRGGRRVSAVCFHRARGDDAFVRVKQRTSRADEYSHRSRVREVKRNTDHP